MNINNNRIAQQHIEMQRLSNVIGVGVAAAGMLASLIYVSPMCVTHMQNEAARRSTYTCIAQEGVLPVLVAITVGYVSKKISEIVLKCIFIPKAPVL